MSMLTPEHKIKKVIFSFYFDLSNPFSILLFYFFKEVLVVVNYLGVEIFDVVNAKRGTFINDEKSPDHALPS